MRIHDIKGTHASLFIHMGTRELNKPNGNKFMFFDLISIKHQAFNGLVLGHMVVSQVVGCSISVRRVLV